MKRNRLIRQANYIEQLSDTKVMFTKYAYNRVGLIHGSLQGKEWQTIGGLVVLFIIGFFLALPSPTDTQDNNSQSQVLELPDIKKIKTSASSPRSLIGSPSSNKPSSPATNSTLVKKANTIEVPHQKLVTGLAGARASFLAWREITVKSGDNLSLIFPRVGLNSRDVYLVTQLDKKALAPLLNLKPGQLLHFGTLTQKDGTLSLEALKVTLNPIETLHVRKVDHVYYAETTRLEIDLIQKHITGKIDSSLFEAGMTAGLTDKVVMEMAHIFGWDIDFALDLRKGDHFKLILNEAFIDGNKVDDGNILAADFTNRGKTFRAIRFVDAMGLGRYYSPEGDSMRKTFNRTPVPLSRISSRFNPNRKHPILKTNRPHRGVDYAAKKGTPILATGDGKVDFIGTKGGYGRTVILSHGGKYTTLYAHMSRYKKGIRSGKRVKQGQTIGYIGSSGLATGPHLHYEFRVNGTHRNPLTVKLPKAEPLPKKYHAQYKAQATPLITQLDVLMSTSLAQTK